MCLNKVNEVHYFNVDAWFLSRSIVPKKLVAALNGIQIFFVYPPFLRMENIWILFRYSEVTHNFTWSVFLIHSCFPQKDRYNIAVLFPFPGLTALSFGIKNVMRED